MQQQPDDPSIVDTDNLWRTCLDLQPDPAGPRCKSSVFKTDEDREISVDVARLSTIADTFARASGQHQYIAEIEAQLPRSFKINPEPNGSSLRYTVYLWDDGTGNRAHAHIHPPSATTRADYDRNAKLMAKKARIISRP